MELIADKLTPNYEDFHFLTEIAPNCHGDTIVSTLRSGG